MKKVLVVGDSCRDIFVYCDSDRLCPDVPVPILNIVDQIENPGMAKNVQRNIISLGVFCDIVTNKGWYNYTKTRYVHKKSNHTFFRVDSPNNMCKFKFNDNGVKYDAIVVSDYNKGFLDESDISDICKCGSKVFLDTKKPLGDWCKDAFVVKINNHEYSRSPSCFTKSLSDKLVVTHGCDGCTFQGKSFPVEKVPVMDVSGAGDTFMAGLVVGFLQSGNLIDAIPFANSCASAVVRHAGVNAVGDLIS